VIKLDRVLVSAVERDIFFNTRFPTILDYYLEVSKGVLLWWRCPRHRHGGWKGMIEDQNSSFKPAVSDLPVSAAIVFEFVYQGSW